MTDIDRIVHVMHAQIYDSEDDDVNTWKYHRAPDGYLFRLQKVDVGVSKTHPYGVMGIFDGHEYTHWDIFPGVESREYIAYMNLSNEQLHFSVDLLGWKCKEYTIGCRSISESSTFKAIVIMWFTLQKASREELLEYALKHPIREDTFKRALRGTTVEPSEAEE